MVKTATFLLLAAGLGFLQQAPVPSELSGARNVTRVDAVLMCGGATTDDAFPALKREGFVSVINLRQATEQGVDIAASRAAAQKAGLKYIHIPVNAAQLDTAAVDAFLASVVDRANQPMYIHCGSANRVGAMWLIKRIVVDRWDVQRATDEATAIGLTNPKLRQLALDYAATHPRR